MRKLVLLLGVISLGVAVSAFAQSAKSADRIKNTKIVHATQDTPLTYMETPIFVPKGKNPEGQTIILGERANNSIVIRGFDIQDMLIGDSAISTKGYSVLSYNPQSKVIFLNRGENLELRDPQGGVFTVQEKGAILTTNALVNSVTLPELQKAAQQEAAQVEHALQAEATSQFLSGQVFQNDAAQQATQDVEETLSPSAPR